jgi:hypothetical protein
MSKRVLLGNMACLADAGKPADRFQGFLKTGRSPFKCFVESILLYDQVAIPTNDFMPLPILAAVLGGDSLIRLLDEDVIKFAKFYSSIVYVGGGNGISTIQVMTSDKKPTFFSAPLDQAARSMIDGLNLNIDKRKIADLAIKSSIEFSLDDKKLKAMTYSEIKRTQGILSAKGFVDLNKLPGVGPDQVRLSSGVYDPAHVDDIYQVLRVAHACLEVNAASELNCDDVYTSDQVAHVFRRALAEAAKHASPSESFVELRELSDLPDIGELVLSDKSVLLDLLKLRNSTDGEQFRRWFHEKCRTEPDKVAKEYIALLKQVPAAQSFGGRVVRYLAQLGIGVATMPLSPVAGWAMGGVAGGIDGFLVDRFARGASPKIFLEKLEALVAKKK